MYYSLLNFGKENFIKKHERRENPKIQTKYQNSTQNLPIQPNLIISSGHRPNFNG